MPAPLAIVSCGGELTLCDGRSLVTAGGRGDASQALLEAWEREFPDCEAARLFIHAPGARRAAKEIAAAARRARRRVEGAWPAETLFQAESGGSRIAVAALGSAVLVHARARPDEPAAFVVCAGPRAVRRAEAEIQESLARADDGSPIRTVLFADPDPALAPLRAALAGTGCQELPLRQLFESALETPPPAGGYLARGPAAALLRKPAARAAAASAAGLACVALLGLNHSARRRAAEAARIAEALSLESAAARTRRLEGEREAALCAALGAPSAPFAAFLCALGPSTPAPIVLTELHLTPTGFHLIGRRMGEPEAQGIALAAFRRALFSPGANWQEAPDPAQAALPGNALTLSGSFVRSPRAPAPALLAEPRFATVIAGECPGWSLSREGRPEGGGLIAERIRLSRADLGSAAWPDLLRVVQRLAAMPGLVFDRLDIEGDSAADGAFSRMELAATVHVLQ